MSGPSATTTISPTSSLQDEITEAVTIAIAPAIAQAEQRRAMRKPPESLDAWAAYQRGLWHFSKWTADDNAVAQKFFEQAIDLDPTFAGGYWGLAGAHYYASYIFPPRGLIEMLSSIEALARRAVVLDGSDAEAHSWLGLILFLLGDCKGGLGREYEAAVEAAEQAIRANPDFPVSRFWLPAALGQLGRTAEAREALEKAIAIGPRLFDVYVRQQVAPFRPEDYAHMLEGMRKAGWNG